MPMRTRRDPERARVICACLTWVRCPRQPVSLAQIHYVGCVCVMLACADCTAAVGLLLSPVNVFFPGFDP